MKALIYTGPNKIEYSDLADPTPATTDGQTDALIRVEASGICGSDVLAYHGQEPRRSAPLILGHEAAGVVVNGP